MTYLRVLLLLGNDTLSDGETIRLNHTDCPAGTDNKRRLYLTNKGGKVLGYCHNCSLKGSASINKNITDIKKQLENKTTLEHKTTTAALAGVIKEDALLFWRGLQEQDVLNLSSNIIKWMNKSNLLTKEKRVVLFKTVSVKTIPECKTIRAFRLALRDKNLNVYGYLHTEFEYRGRKRQLLNIPTVKQGHYATRHIDAATLIITEDCFSAEVLAEALKNEITSYTIVALLGTNMPATLRTDLTSYSKIILALDGDNAGVSATLKIIAELKCLGISRVSLSIRDSKDPKNLGLQNLNDLVKGLQINE